MTNKRIFFMLLLSVTMCYVYGQNTPTTSDSTATSSAAKDVDKWLDASASTSNKTPINNAFKSLQIVQSQSTKLPQKKDFYLSFNHRFGSVKQGISEFFGLDQATMKLNFIYGITDWLAVGISRSTYHKTYEGALKYRLAAQSEKFPIAIVGYSNMGINTADKKSDYPMIKFANRLNYTNQLLLSRKFSDKFSFQLSPTYVHTNTVSEGMEKHDEMLIGGGGRYKLSKRLSLNAEYFYNLNKPEYSPYVNPLSLGLDIDTGGHIFQIVLTNSQPSTEAGYFTNGVGKKGNLYLGFNLYRIF